MTTLDLTQPHYIPLMHSGLIERVLCGLKLHDWSHWTMNEAILNEGRKYRSIIVQTRQCIRPRCRINQVKKL